VNLTAKFESSSPYSSLKRSVPGAFNVDLIGSGQPAPPYLGLRHRHLNLAGAFYERQVEAEPAVAGQGLTLVHYSAQPEPFLTRSTPFKPPTPPNTLRHLLNTRKITPKQTLNAPPIPQKALTLS